MAIEVLDFLVTGGKANAGPPVGPALGPLGVNIGEIIAAINQKTSAMAGMDVPIKLTVDTTTKTFEIEVGTPPTSALIKKAIGIEKGSGTAWKADAAGDISLDAIKQIAETKSDTLLANAPNSAIKQVIGTCVSLGVTVDGKHPRNVIAELSGKEAVVDMGAMQEAVAAAKAAKEEAAAQSESAPNGETVAEAAEQDAVEA
jgi:large subunit ribosomal protein L11